MSDVRYTREEVADMIGGLRQEFLRFLTEDVVIQPGGRRGRRRKISLAIFDEDRGYAIWTNTDLDMVMEKFDEAVKGVTPR